MNDGILLKFESYKTYKITHWNVNYTIQIISLCIAIGVLGVMNFIGNNNLITYVLGVLLLGVLIISSGVRLYSFFAKYESKKEKDGYITFLQKSIKWNKLSINWKEIQAIRIGYNEIDGKLDLSELSPQNNRSDGINEIHLKLHNKELNGWFKINNIKQKEDLLKLFNEVILINNLKYEICKSLLKPSNYKEHQELKKRIENSAFNVRKQL